MHCKLTGRSESISLIGLTNVQVQLQAELAVVTAVIGSSKTNSRYTVLSISNL